MHIGYETEDGFTLVGWTVNGYPLRRGTRGRIYPTFGIAERYAKGNGYAAVPVWVRKEDL